MRSRKMNQNFRYLSVKIYLIRLRHTSMRFSLSYASNRRLFELLKVRIDPQGKYEVNHIECQNRSEICDQHRPLHNSDEIRLSIEFSIHILHNR